MRARVLAPPTRVERVVGTVVLRVLGVLLVATALVVLVDPRDPNVVFRRPLVLAGLLGAAVLTAVAVALDARIGSRPLGRGRAWSWAVAVAVAGVGAGAGTSVARRLEYVYGWDAAVMARFSEALHTSGTMSPYAVDYLSRYPHNLPLLAMLNASRTAAGWAGTTMEVVFVALNGLGVAIVLLSSYALVRMLRGHRPALAAQLVLLLLLGASPWVAVPYTDLLVLPFVTVGLLLAVAAIRARRMRSLVPLWLGSVAVLAMGFPVKSTVMPALVAVALVAGLVVLGSARDGVRPLALGVVLIAAGGVVFVGTTTAAVVAAQHVSRVDPARLVLDQAPPISWWVAMGLSTTPTADGRTYYGSYSGTMVRESMTLRGEHLQVYSEEALRARVSELGAGGLAAFAVDKQAFNWGDGMFFAWGEGLDADPDRLLRDDPSSRWVQSWNHVSGSHYLSRASLTTGVWLFVVSWTGVGLIGAPYRREVLVVAATVLMFIGLLLVIQARSKYLLACLPVLVVLGGVVDPRSLRRRPATNSPHG